MGVRSVASDRVIAERYRLGDRLGRGAMGSVWSATDLRLRREVAVKLGHRDADADLEAIRRFEREAALAARLNHPNAVSVLDAGVDDGTPFLVMERLVGVTLADRLRDGPLDDDELRALAHDLPAVLAAAHEAGLLHRDVKPSNVLVGNHGEWKLGDFGIAKPLDEGHDDLTRTGLVVGTPGYLAPERHLGASATVAGDVFAAGVVIHEAATGTRPLAAVDLPTQALAPGDAEDRRHAEPVVRAADPAGGRAALLAALAPALALDPADRFADAAAMAEALAAAMPPRGSSPADPRLLDAGDVGLAFGDVGTGAVAAPTVSSSATVDATTPLPTALIPAGAGGGRSARPLAVALAAVVLLALAWAAVGQGSGTPATAGDEAPVTTVAPTTTAAPSTTQATVATTPPTTVAPPPTTVAPPEPKGKDATPKGGPKGHGKKKR